MKSILSIYLVSSLSLFAILDTNNNQISDLWEREFHQGNLVPANWDMFADSDHDGYQNFVESTTGTNPYDSGLVTGQPQLKMNSNNGYIHLSWNSLTGKEYTIETTTNLNNDYWSQETLSSSQKLGDGKLKSISLIRPITKKVNFYRLGIDDIQTRSDGLTEYEYHQLLTNSLFKDFDKDGVENKDDSEPLTSFRQADPKDEQIHSNLPIPVAYWTFEQIFGSFSELNPVAGSVSAPNVATPSSNDFNLIYGVDASTAPTGNLSSTKGGLLPTSPASAPYNKSYFYTSPRIINNYNDFSISMWVKINSNSIRNNSGYTSLFSYQNSSPAERLFAFAARGVNELNSAGTGIERGINLSVIKENAVIEKSINIPANLRIDDNAWHHMVINRGSSVFQIYIDNVLILNSNETAANTSGFADENGFLAFGNFSPKVIQLNSAWPMKGMFDRIRVYRQTLSTSQVQILSSAL